MNLIEQLRNSGNKLLETEAEDIAKWSKLRHSKKDLELFLTFNLAEIQFKTKDGNIVQIVCTSNTTLIKIFSLDKDKDKEKIKHLKPSGIKTKDMNSVLTWDLIENKYKTLSLTSWQIMNFISITKNNILILDKVIRDLLKK